MQPDIEIISRSPEHTREVGRRLGSLARPGDVLLMVGRLGAGKTCLTQGIAWALGITEYTASPSFVLVREYHGRLPLYHIDLYRLERVEEIADLGLDEYLYGKGLCVVEWADRAMGLMPPQHLLIEFTYLSLKQRRLRLEAKGQRYEEMAGALNLEDLSRTTPCC